MVGRGMLHVLDECGHGVLGGLLPEREPLHVGGCKRVRQRDVSGGRSVRVERVARGRLEDLGEAVSRELVEGRREELVCSDLAREIDDCLARCACEERV